MPVKHVFAGERFQAFSDAIFAIVATIMVIPLKLSESDVELKSFSLDGYLRERSTLQSFGIYLYAFLLVVDAWYAHNRVFHLVEQVDDIVVWLNLLVLLFVSFLPATIVMVRSFDNSAASITTASITIMIVDVSLCVVLFYAFRQQDVLHTELSRDLHRRTLKWTMYIPLLINPIFALLAISFSVGLDGAKGQNLGVAFFYMIGTVASIVRYIVWKVQKYRYRDQIPTEATAVLMENNVSKERIAAFSDGIFSVVATIVLLDLTTGNIEELFDKFPHITMEELVSRCHYVFLTYVDTFFIVGLLWFVHHSMFQFFRATNSSITFFNTLGLCLVGLIPFAAQAVSSFSNGENGDNELTAIRLLSLVITLVGIFYLAIWACAHFQKRHVLSVAIEDKASEGIMYSKLLVLPCVGLITYFVTFSEHITVHYFFSVVVCVTPILLMTPSLVYSLVIYCYRRNNSARHLRPHRVSSTFSNEGCFSRYRIQEVDESKPLMEDEEEAEEEGEDEVFPTDHSHQAASAIVPLKRQQQNEPSDPKKIVTSGNCVI